MTDIRIGDCLSVLPTLPENSVDSIITDPPYHLASIVKRFGNSVEDNEHYANDTVKVNPFARMSKSGFMGKEWDSDVAFRVEVWQAALRVAKPGAILMAFGGTRTFHRLACAIEDAGWEIRDTMCWLYGSGFPKSLDISKAIDKAAGVQPIGSKPPSLGMANNPQWNPCYQQLIMPEATTDMAHLWQGYGTALKPAWEPIIVAMKPLEGTYAENAQKWGVAGLNIDGGRIGTETTQVNTYAGRGPFGESQVGNTYESKSVQGRWPANLLLDEESARLLGEASRFFYTSKASSSERNAGLEDMPLIPKVYNGKSNHSASCLPGSVEDKCTGSPAANFHPTVKPLDLMRYLCKLTRTPTGGVVLDPFAGSGTTGIACILEHRDFIGIEIDEKYAEIAKKRIADMEGPLFTGGKYGE
jgi:DNA modification methylase